MRRVAGVQRDPEALNGAFRWEGAEHATVVAAEGVDAGDRVGEQALPGAVVQPGIAAAQGDPLSVERQRVHVLALRVPFHTAAVIRIGAALHPDLVAVVDERHAGRREQEHRRQGGPLRARGRFRRVTRQQRAHAGGIVAAEEVEQARRDGGRVAVPEPLQLAVEPERVQTPCEIAEHRVAPRVVHHGVELVPLQPGGRVVPDLAQDPGVGLRSLHALPEQTPERVVHLVRHVQPPAVDVGVADPVLRDAQEVLGARRVCRVQLRHVAQPRGERLVVGERGIDGEGIDPVEPGDVARRGSVAPHVAER